MLPFPETFRLVADDCTRTNQLPKPLEVFAEICPGGHPSRLGGVRVPIAFANLPKDIPHFDEVKNLRTP